MSITTPVRRIRRPRLAEPNPAKKKEEETQAKTLPKEEASSGNEGWAQAEARGELEEQDRAEREAILAERAAGKVEEEAEAVRAVASPSQPAHSEVRRDGAAVQMGPDFEARDGDILVVSYPEVTLPLPRPYSMMKFGGLIYTRQLRAGDDVEEQLNKIGSWVSRRAEAEGAAKYRRMVAQFIKKGS